MMKGKKHELAGPGRSLRWVAVTAFAVGAAACGQEEPPKNAAQQSSIDNAMEEVKAAQVRSDINVAEVKAAEDLERQQARERQRSTEKSAE